MMTTIGDALLFLSRAEVLMLVAKVTLVFGLGLIAVSVAAQAKASVRHLLLAATFAAVLVLPVAIAIAPQIAIPIATHALPGPASPNATRVASQAAGAPALAREQPSAPGAWTELSWAALLGWAWAAGSAVMGLFLAVGIMRVARLRRNALPRADLRELSRSLRAEVGLATDIDVLEHEAVSAPLTCGVWRPAILLPSDARSWSEDDLRRALVHELAHVRRGDWLVQLVARLACVCYWFHPLAWMAWRHLALEAERACDDVVIRREERTDYADQLVLLARRLANAQAPTILGMANRSDLSVRIRALLDSQQRRGRAGLLATASVILIATGLVTTIAPVRAMATPDAIVGVPDDQSASPPRVARALDRALYEAAEEGDIQAIDELLAAGANVNCALVGDGSPLIAAARSARVTVVRHLLDRGADPNMPVPGDGSPLIAAAAEGAATVVALLLDRGARIDQVVEGDENALIQASARGRLEVVKFLVGRGANVNARVWVDRSVRQPGGEWRTPLSMARQGGHTSVAAFLISAGARE